MTTRLELSVGAVLALLLLALPAQAGDGCVAARREALAGDVQKAIEMSRSAVKSDPADLASARLLQDLLIEAGRDAELARLTEELSSAATRDYLALRTADPKDAVDGFRALLGREGAPSHTQLDLAWAEWRADKRGPAESDVKAYLKDHPGDAEGHYLLGVITYSGKGSARAAREPLEKAIQVEPGRPDAVILLTRVLHELDDAPTARQVLVQALGVYPQNPTLRLGLIEDQARAEEFEPALKGLETLIQEHPRLAAAHAWRAYVLRRLQEYKDAEASARAALEIDPNQVLALETLGFLLVKQKKFEEALEAYRKALQLAPTRVEPYVGVGFVHMLMGKLDFAKDMLEQAMKIDKKDIDLNRKYGILQYLLGKYRTARKYLDIVLSADENDVPALRYTGYALLAEGRAKEAWKVLDQATQLSPYDSLTLRMAGRALSDLGKKDEALEMFERAVEADKSDPWAHFDVGKALDERGEFEAAKQEYEEALALDPTFYWPYLYLAELWDEIDGEAVEAVKCYRKFLELGGPDPEGDVKKRIEQLEGN